MKLLEKFRVMFKQQEKIAHLRWMKTKGLKLLEALERRKERQAAQKLLD